MGERRRELYPFELEIALRFRAAGLMGASPKGEWVRGYLLTFGRGYPYGMWREWREFAETIGVRPGTYTSFVRYLYALRRLGLVRLVGYGRRAGGFERHYYAVAPGAENSPLWMRPLQALYPGSCDWTIKPPEVRSELRRRYRKKEGAG